MQKRDFIKFTVLITLFSMMFIQCEDSNPSSSEKTLAELITSVVSSVTDTSAICGGTISSEGSAPVTSRGVCWDTTATPTIENNKTEDGNGGGIYSSVLSGLSPGTKYYVRAYATTSVGTAYGIGNAMTFTTSAILAQLSTTPISSITATTAKSGGTIISDGGSTVIARGVCWDTTATPTVENNKTEDGNGVGIYSSVLSGLSLGTKYYVRAYATTSVGTAYGDTMSFTTIGLPKLSTTPISSITDTSAKCGGTIISDGGSSIIVRGVCWDTTATPTIENNKTEDGNGVGIYSSILSGLSPGTKYYVRAYATTSVGTAYGDTIIFTTNAILAQLSTTPISLITGRTARCGGTIISDGGSTVIARGVCWSTTATPIITAANRTEDGDGGGIYCSVLSDLSPGTRYFVRAYATTSVGTAYGETISFETLSYQFGTLTDIDGNEYKTVKIGKQWWMAENLKVTHYSTGSPIPNVTDNDEWESLSWGAYCAYDNDNANVEKYGLLYNWYAVNDRHNIAPAGWHVPTEEEWQELEDYLIAKGYNYDGTTEGNKTAKSLASQTDWATSTSNGGVGNDLSKNNASGFTALPGGMRHFVHSYAIFLDIGNFGYWWSATVSGSTEARHRFLSYHNANFIHDHISKQAGFSVRLIKD